MGLLQQALGNATDFISNLFGSASQATDEKSTSFYDDPTKKIPGVNARNTANQEQVDFYDRRNPSESIPGVNASLPPQVSDDKYKGGKSGNIHGVNDATRDSVLYNATANQLLPKQNNIPYPLRVEGTNEPIQSNNQPVFEGQEQGNLSTIPGIQTQQQIPGITPQPTMGGNLADFGGKIRLADGTVSGEQGQTRKDQFNQLKLAMSQAGKTDISNADFYPSAGESVEMGNVGAGGYSAPVYAGGSAVLFPIAGYDKMAQRREQERMMSRVIDDQNRAKMVFDLPQINQKVLADKFMPQYNNELFGLMGQLKEELGADIYKKGATHPKTLEFISKWKAIPQGLNDVVTRIESYEKRKAERKPGDYFDPMLDELSKQILGGADEFFKGGNISASELYEAGNKFRAYENVHNNIIDTLKVIKPSESVPLLDAEVQKQLAINPALNRQYMEQVGLPNSPEDYKKWIINQSVIKISDEQAEDFATSFMNSYSGAAEKQLSLPGDDPAQIKQLVHQRLKDMYQGMAGTQIKSAFEEWQAKGKGTTINFGSGGGQEKQGFFESTVLGAETIKSNLNNNAKNPNLNITEKVEFGFNNGPGGSWRTEPNDPYVRVGVPGQKIEGSTTPERYSDYLQPTTTSGSGAVGGQFAPIGKDKDGKDILSQFGVTDRNQTPKSAKIISAKMAWAVRDPKTQQWNLITKDNYGKNGLPPGAKQVIIEEQILYNKQDATASDTEIEMPGSTQGEDKTKGLKAYKVYEATLEAVRPIDNKTNPTTSNEGAQNFDKKGGFSGTVTIEDASL